MILGGMGANKSTLTPLYPAFSFSHLPITQSSDGLLSHRAQMDCEWVNESVLLVFLFPDANEDKHSLHTEYSRLHRIPLGNQYLGTSQLGTSCLGTWVTMIPSAGILMAAKCSFSCAQHAHIHTLTSK